MTKAIWGEKGLSSLTTHNPSPSKSGERPPTGSRN